MDEFSVQLPLLSGLMLKDCANEKEMWEQLGVRTLGTYSDAYGPRRHSSMKLLAAYAVSQDFFLFLYSYSGTCILCYGAHGTVRTVNATNYALRSVIKKGKRRQTDHQYRSISDILDNFQKHRNFYQMLEAAMDVDEKKKPKWLPARIKEARRELLNKQKRFEKLFAGKVYGRALQM